MTYFLKQGNVFKPADEAALDIHNELPPGNYTIKQDEYRNFFFEQVDSFEMKHKIYGDTLRNCDRIINTFQDRPNSTGVLLTGEKGSGKTLLAKAISLKAAELGMPTIIINTDWHGDPFNTLIQSIEQPCVILFDEFEKVYDRETQPAILTLLDGVFPTRKLFVLTCNDKWRVDDHMRNRPGRIYYMLDFRGLSLDFIREYCEENLNDKGQVDPVCKASSMFSEFNFDMLKSLVEEMNRYGETAQEAIKLLNTKPTNDTGGEYQTELTIAGKIFSDNLYPKTYDRNPLSMEKLNISLYPERDGDDDDNGDDRALVAATPVAHGRNPRVTSGSFAQFAHDVDSDGEHRFEFTCNDLKAVDAMTGALTYVNERGATLKVRKVKKPELSYVF